ncbi:MAG TPA: DNA internalization-related competence protein ComEC/Rec2, partial [Thermoanaerobaculia bacterium]|nr:DNA internalization-related competence protein ComEC/Rec2 [Thermoanaerobaculia bacterium]
LAALAFLGLAWGRRAGLLLACCALGLLVAVVRGPFRESGPDLDRPLDAVVRVAGHWTADDEGWSAPARLLRCRQGLEVSAPPLEVLVHIPGPDEEPPAFGTVLRLRGYLARSVGFANRVPVQPGPWRLRVKSRSLMEVEEPPGRIAQLSSTLRRRVETAYRVAAGEETGPGIALVRALVLGDASALPLEWKRGLRVTGVYHLMSVSGVHVALVAGAVWLLGFWLPRSIRLLLMLAAIGGYLLLVGPLPALVRAALMGLLAVSALLAERPPAAANALGWAVIVLVLDRPDLVNAPAFQLTVSATAGLLLATPALARRWHRLPRWLAGSLAASVAAQLATLPWSLPRFHLLSPLAPLLNLPAVPWTGLALGVALVWTPLALLAPSLAGALVPVLDRLAAPFSWPAETGPAVWLPVPLLVSPPAAWLAAGLLGLALLWRPRHRLLRWTALPVAALAGTAILAWPWLPGGRAPARGVEISLLDVGQGDAILLRDGDRAVLVDGGGWRKGDLGGRVLLPALLGEEIRSLDALVMTHPDRDHCGGLLDIAAYIPVREVWMSPGWEGEECADRLRALPGARTRFLWAGERGAVGRWRLRILHPERDEERGGNERSLVILAEALERRALLTGDIESWAEMRLLACCERDLRVDFLKVAHHGSKTSTTTSFLEAARPRLALVSAGPGNIYYHPSPVVVERLEEHGAGVLRTDRDGLIRIALLEDGGTRIELPGAPR